MTLSQVSLWFLLFMFFVPKAVQASQQTMCFPRNKLHLKPASIEKSNISERLFNDIISRAEKLYAPIVLAHKAKLKIHRLWKDNTVNASAIQSAGLWEVNMYGGLARRPEVTPDGFALVLCHELGHHLGGYVMTNDEDNEWASNEGQSDYFATDSCAKELWKGDLEENARHRNLVSPLAKKLCDSSYSDLAARDLCYRSANAGLSLSTLLATLRGSVSPKFETPSKSVVQRTDDNHPEAQCRLDTYMAGALCTLPFDRSVIPGKGLTHGGASPEAEALAGQSSCLARDGWVSAQRPRCWFKPYFEFEGLIAGKHKWSDLSGNGQVEPGEILELSIPIENRRQQVTGQVIGEIFSKTPGVKVTQLKSTYPDIEPGQVALPISPFEIKVSKAIACGRPFELVFRASSAEGSREFPVRWFVGPKLSDDFVLERRTDELAIDDYPSPGLTLAFDVFENISSPELILSFLLGGLYPEEIRVSLTSPHGQLHELKTEGGFDTDGRAQVRVHFDMPMNLRGTWRLNLRDTQENDTMTLKSFDLRAPFAEVVSCSK